MKNVIIFFFCFTIISTLNAQTDISAKQFYGQWYQFESSDGKVIKLFKEKCYNESLNEDHTRLLSTEYKSIDWSFNRLGTYLVKNHHNDSLSHKGKLSFSKSTIKLGGINYIISDSHFSFWDEDTYAMTLVREDYFEMYATIKSQTEQLRLLLNDNWMVVPIDSGFSVYYNRGGNVEFESHFIGSQSNINIVREQGDSTKDYFTKKGQGTVRKPQTLSYTINNLSPDSVCWFTYINAFTANPTYKDRLNFFRKDGVLKIEVKFAKKWSTESIKYNQQKNDTLKQVIIDKGWGRLNYSIFSDYRYWIPQEYYKNRLKVHNYYFERLPYESAIKDYSIFINPNSPSIYTQPLFVDDSDSLYFEKETNFLNNEYQRTLRIVALSLGIQDFEIVNSHSALNK